MTLLLNRGELERLLDAPSVIDAVEHGFADYAAGKVQMPTRTAVRISDPPGALLVMPCAMTASRALGTKLVSAYLQNPERGLPTIGALYVLSDYETGFPIAVMDAAFITGLRTAAASAVATKYLAREDSKTLGIFGTGVQGEFHALAIPAVRPIERILVRGTTPEKARQFAERMQGRVEARVEPAESVEAAAGADVVVLGTTAPTPLFPSGAVRDGAHVNGVGAHSPTVREVDGELVARSTVVVDTYDAAFAEAGDLLLAIEEGAISRDHVGADLGEIVSGKKRPRQRPDEVTFFKSCGVALEDAVTASLALERARAQGVGTEYAFG